MTREEVRRRVADALCKGIGLSPTDLTMVRTNEKPEPCWKHQLPKADAAIAALLDAVQEPSEAMTEVSDATAPADARAIWIEMLAELRKELLP